LFAEIGLRHGVGFVHDEGAGIDGEEGETGGGGAMNVCFGFEVVGISAPRFGKTGDGEGSLSGLHNFFGGSLGAVHFANGLLGEDGGEVAFARGGDVARGGEAEAIAVAEGFF
jgi:hypothetical protein